jgi:pimeloyl-ACP methyl ester carboxylesterase
VERLIFFPGAGGSEAFWRPVADRLAHLGDRFIVGYPGFGGVDPAPQVNSLDDLYRWTVARLPPGASHIIAQSMGGILAARLAIEQPERIGRLVLVATTGGVDVQRLGAEDWRAEYLESMPHLPRWFIDDRTDLTDRLGAILAPTLLLWSDSDPLSPLAVAHFLRTRIHGARIVTVAGGSHAFANERPDEVAAIIAAHLIGPRDETRARERRGR